MQVVCPRGAKPGDTIEMNVPGIGKMRVKVPPKAKPGKPFYFRVRKQTSIW